jgi:hypothetical protein
MTYFLGLDLGGTSVKGVAVTPDGETLAKFHESFALAIAAWDGPIRGEPVRPFTDSHRDRVPLGTLPFLARRRRWPGLCEDVAWHAQPQKLRSPTLRQHGSTPPVGGTGSSIG